MLRATRTIEALLLLLAVIATGHAQDASESTLVPLQDCELTRGVPALLLIYQGPNCRQVVKQGVLEVDGAKFGVYLPKSKRYATENTADPSDPMRSTSTLISVDEDGDGKLSEAEAFWAHQPVRVGDAMFEVAEIAADGGSIRFRPSKAPLSGAIPGRRCPEFSYKTEDGRTLTPADFAGKAFLIDVWSVT